VHIFKARVYAFPLPPHMSHKNFPLSAYKHLAYAQLKMNNCNALHVFPTPPRIHVMYIIVLRSK